MQGRDQDAMRKAHFQAPPPFSLPGSDGLPLRDQALEGALGMLSGATLQMELAHMEQGNV